MIKVGLTGGIGSGKSLICRIFSILEVPVYHADAEAKKLTNEDPEIREQLILIAGPKAYTEQGLNRAYLADLIFNNKVLLDRVNSLIHPKVARHFSEWCTSFVDKPYIIHESAILFKSNFYKSFDKIIAVTAPVSLRETRVLERPNMTREKFRSIMDAQMPEEEMTRRADYVIVNDEKTLVIPQVLELHKIFHAAK